MIKLFKQAKRIRDLEGVMRVESLNLRQMIDDLRQDLKNNQDELHELRRHCVRMGINPSPQSYAMSEVKYKDVDGATLNDDEFKKLLHLEERDD